MALLFIIQTVAHVSCCESLIRNPKDNINKRILQTMISGILLILGLGARMSDPCACIVSNHTILYHTIFLAV